MKPVPKENPLPKQGRGFPKYFYLNGDLHQKIRIETGADRLEAWNHKEDKVAIYSLHWARKHKKRAFTVREAALLINRSYHFMTKMMYEGAIHRPQYLKANKRGWNKTDIGQYMFSEEDIKALHDYLTERGGPGYPRKDGRRRTLNLPPWRLIRAWIDEDEVMYVMRDGEMIPTFIAEDF